MSERAQRPFVADAAAEVARDFGVLADEVAPPRMAAKLAAPELEGGIERERDPARLVAPVFEDRRARPQQLLPHARVQPLEARQEDDRVAARSRHGDGVELEVAEAADHGVHGGGGGRTAAARAARQARWLGGEEAGTGQGQAAGGTDAQGVQDRESIDRSRGGRRPPTAKARASPGRPG